MGYRIILDPTAEASAKALPPAVRPVVNEVMTTLGLVPWNGKSINEDSPDGEVRQMTFGPQNEGMVTYLILEREREVHVLLIQWVG